MITVLLKLVIIFKVSTAKIQHLDILIMYLTSFKINSAMKLHKI